MFPLDTYFTLSALIFGMNVIPVFMPPTWIILSFFYSRYHLALFPTVIMGATMATLGRVILAQIARVYGRKIIPKNFLANYESLGNVIEKHQTVSIPLIFTYAFFPLSSNVIYIVAGLSNIRVRLIALSFFIGRLISYSFWITAVKIIGNSLDTLLIRHFSKSRTVVIELLSIGIILLIGSLNWRTILGLNKNVYLKGKKIK